MGWRTVLISGRAKLDLKLNHLVVRKEEIVKVSINEIQTLIIDSTQVSLTTALLAELSRSKVKVIFCDEKHNPIGELTSYYAKHNSSLMIKKQISWSQEAKTLVWTEIIRDKISKQSDVLFRNKKDEFRLLRQYLEELQSGDSTNREGHAAKVYFNALFGKGFKREDNTPTNAALNYGYSILLSSFNQEVVNNGLVTQLGIFHDNQFNQYNLSSDIMEPFRPLVDSKVLQLKPNKFDTDEKLEILSILDSTVFIDNKECVVSNAIGIYTRSVIDAINNCNLMMLKQYDCVI